LNGGSDHAILGNVRGDLAFGVGDDAFYGHIHVEMILDQFLDHLDLVWFVNLGNQHITGEAKDQGLSLNIDHAD
jgi:hypothetical protein